MPTSLAGASLDVDARKRILLGLCDLFEALSTCSFVHGELQPSDIFYDDSRAGALCIGSLPGLRSHFELDGPLYAMAATAREQLQRHAADEYALGALAYRLHLPEQDFVRVFERLGSGQALARLDEVSNECSVSLADVIQRAVSREVTDRFESTSALVAGLRAALEVPVEHVEREPVEVAPGGNARSWSQSRSHF